MSKIIDIKAREILDSRGYPTVEVTVKSERGIGIHQCLQEHQLVLVKH